MRPIGTVSPATIVVARRWDGHGGRLCALLNAISLARVLGLEFRFVWPRTAEWGFSEPRELFHDDFLARFEIPETALERRVALSDPTDFSLADATAYCLEADADSAVYVDECFHVLAFADETRESAQARFRAALDAINWNASVQGLVARISNRDIPSNYSAVHVRAGDIVTGAWRQFVPGDKYMPTPFVEFAIEILSGTCGDPVLVVSDNVAYLSYLKNRFNQVELSSDFIPGYSDLTEMQSTFADNLALSRARRIVGPQLSAFSQLGAQLGGISVQSIDDLTTEDNAARILRDGITRGEKEAEATEALRPLLARDMCWYHDVFYEHLSLKERMGLARRAVDLDPDFCGALNRVAAATALGGQYDEAAKVAAEALSIAAKIERHDDPLVESLATSVSGEVLALIAQSRRASRLLRRLGGGSKFGFAVRDDERDTVLQEFEKRLAQCEALEPFHIDLLHLLQNLRFQTTAASWLSIAPYRLSRIANLAIGTTVSEPGFLKAWRPTGFRELAKERPFPQALRNVEAPTIHIAHAIGRVLSQASTRTPSFGNVEMIETCLSGSQWVHGWIYDRNARRSPSVIGFVHGNEIVSGGTISLPRPDVATALEDPRALNCGFAFPVPSIVDDVGDLKSNVRVL